MCYVIPVAMFSLCLVLLQYPFTYTPLQAAAWGGHVSCCRIMLEHGVDVNAVDEVGLVNATSAL